MEAEKERPLLLEEEMDPMEMDRSKEEKIMEPTQQDISAWEVTPVQSQEPEKFV